MKRRTLLTGAATGYLYTQAPILLANQKTAQVKKLVWVLLRGGLDSLHVVMPMFDEHFLQHRARFIKPIAGQLQPLSQGYALHPAMRNAHALFKQKQMCGVVAVGMPKQTRSHFEAQDLLECGLDDLDHNSGWLARAVSQRGREGGDGGKKGESLAIARSTPIALRGQHSSKTWYPSALPPASDDLYQRLMNLYEEDAYFQKALADGMATRASLSMSDKKGKRRPSFVQLAQQCGELMFKQADARCAMLELGGWDTHVNEFNGLHNQLSVLDQGIAALQKTLGNLWQDTVVIVSTEFGRTVPINGTNGTDHGTGSAMLLFGGALKSANVHGRWPGLGPGQLLDGRDVMPTSDPRSWMATILAQHWGLGQAALSHVFPGIAVQPVKLV